MLYIMYLPKDYSVYWSIKYNCVSALSFIVVIIFSSMTVQCGEGQFYCYQDILCSAAFIWYRSVALSNTEKPRRLHNDARMVRRCRHLELMNKNK